MGSGIEPWIMNHSGFKVLNATSVVGSRIPGNGWGFDWRAAEVGHAGLWGLQNRGLFSEAGEATGRRLRTCVLREGAALPDQTCTVGTLPCEEEGIGKGPECKQGDLVGSFCSGSRDQ